MAQGRLCSRDSLILTAMVLTEFSNVGVNTLVKSVTSKGLSPCVVLVYSYGFGSLLLLPLAFFSFRSRSLPPLTSLILYKMGLLGLIVSAAQIAGYNGIKYSSPTLSSAMSNVNPAFTFIFAVIFRMEKVSIRKESSLAKVLGTLLSIVGALVVTLYHGPVLMSMGGDLQGTRVFVDVQTIIYIDRSRINDHFPQRVHLPRNFDWRNIDISRILHGVVGEIQGSQSGHIRNP